MLVITVARKPLAEANVAANVLAHGAGALNIKATRISTSAADAIAMEWCNTPGSHRLQAVDSPIGTFGRSSSSGALDTKAGRWPANLILGHLAGCREAGTQSIHVQRGSPGRGAGGQHGTFGHIGKGEGHDFRNADGTETVSAWECAASCPVAALDADSAGASRFFKLVK